MKNFVFSNDTKIVFGKGKISTVFRDVPEDAKILMIYGGGSIKANGVYDQVVEALSDYKVVEFPGVEPNPSYETCKKALEVIEEHELDFILAVGGGSVIDAAKFIAAAYCYTGLDPWDILAVNEPVEDALPIGVVLTLPATGSEMNGSSVISRLEYKEKLSFNSPLVQPVFSILDPTVVESLPERQRGNGVVDSFIHVMEQYLTYPVDAMVQDRTAEGILKTLIEIGPKVIADATNYSVNANFMWAATMALNGIIACGVPQDWTSHMIGHEITALHGVDHARTLAIVLPGVMNIMRDSKKDKLIQYAQRVWDIQSGSEQEIIDQAIQKTVDFFEVMGLKTRLRDYQIPITTIEEIVERMEERGSVNIGENKEVGIDEIRKILKDRF